MVLEGKPAKAETIGAALGCIFFFVTQLAIELSKWIPPACSGQEPTMSEAPPITPFSYRMPLIGLIGINIIPEYKRCRCPRAIHLYCIRKDITNLAPIIVPSDCSLILTLQLKQLTKNLGFQVCSWGGREP